MTAKEKYSYANGHLKQINIENVLGEPYFIVSAGGEIKEDIGGTIVGYSLNAENELGQVTKQTLGNIDFSLSYSDAGILQKRKATANERSIAIYNRKLNNSEEQQTRVIDSGIISMPDSAIVIPIPDIPTEPISRELHDIEYYYYKNTGNLEMRGEPEYDTWETYYYDSLNRLTGSEFNKTRYDNKGNITHQSDYGDFTYNTPGKPYAISGASLFSSDIATDRQQITYCSFSKPSTITEGNKRVEFSYNDADSRVMMRSYVDDELDLTRYYLGNCYEIDETPDGTKEKLYLTGDFYSAGVVLVKENGNKRPYSIARDELGSIINVVDWGCNVLQDVRYDAWGRIRDPESMNQYTTDNMPELVLGRGFTGHEHLPQFGLINMNARLYDPMLGRFLSPDPYVQMPDFSQSFNRYAYCLNNPLIHKDENGEFFFTILSAVYDGIKGFVSHGFAFKKYDWTRTQNAFTLEKRIFRGCNFKNLGSWMWMYTLTAPAASATYMLNLFGKVDKITEMDGMLAVAGPLGNTGKAMTIGYISIGPKNYVADWRDNLFVHEYGHYIQGQYLGPLFYWIVGIKSLLNAAYTSDWDRVSHNHRWFETNASMLASKHFDKKYGRGKPGYLKNSPDYFDLDTFLGTRNDDSPYTNPRLKSKEQGSGFLISSPHISIFDFIPF